MLPALAAEAQPDSMPRHATVFDLSGAVGPTLNYTSAAGWQLWGIDKKGRFQAGLGGRVSYFWSGRNEFDNQNGPGKAALLTVEEPRLLAFNVAFHVRARVAGPVSLGFNLDMLGATFGPDRSGMLLPDMPFQRPPRPVWNNLLLGGTADRGSLNSEFYASLALPHRLSLRGGWSHIVTAYEVDGTRYRRFHNLAVLGISYRLPDKP
ncbi:hypothetical protein GCM10023185_24630 [Hymenobacter saemangeumensis]|uniref:Outer membrane protein beta-barrel domain-containing protein n=2 Tax=Hymenobacter saemangeumensis TaxID=1084522 RepID=A0ABP8IGZ2_9BACT